MRIAALFFGAACVLAACDEQPRPAFDGEFFRASVGQDGEGRDSFAVKVRPVSASAAGALEAGRYEATRFCVLKFGTSDIIWYSGPDQDPETLAVDNDTVVLRGVCGQ